MHEPDKHSRYLDSYKADDYFWGIGIENETYFQFVNLQKQPIALIYQNHRAERYSVDYFKGLDPEYKQLLKSLFPPTQDTYEIPIYVNAHSFLKTDLSGNHATTYEKVPKPNPVFSGKTLLEFLQETDPKVFKDKYKINYMFDGDSIEFMTQKFYKTTVKQCFKELVTEKLLFLKSLNQVLKKRNLYRPYGELIYPKRNEPFVTFLTNMKNITTFNNGTYHINLTIPTKLNQEKQPDNMAQFVAKHKAAIRYIQFLEPLIISVYGTPDPFAAVSPKFSRASQRCAASRYIGLGTYDTDIMLTGKVLQIEVKDLTVAKNDFWWYTVFHKTSDYLPLEKTGLDINFNKHGVHGIEIRFLDWFPEDRLSHLIKTFIYVLDFSLFRGLPENPIHNPLWNQIVVKCLQGGKTTFLTDEEYGLYVTVFDIPLTEKRMVGDVYELIEKRIRQNKGLCHKLMIGSSWF
jgi:hypothetical protein